MPGEGSGSESGGEESGPDERGPGETRQAPEPAGHEGIPPLGVPEELRRLTRGSAARPGPTVVVRGTLRRAEVEMRPLVLDADDGTTWELLLPAGWVLDAEPGARVTVSGDRATDVVTTSMVGPVLRVRSLSTER